MPNQTDFLAWISESQIKARRRKHARQLANGKAVDSARVTRRQTVIQCQALVTDPPYGILDEAWEPAEVEAFTRAWAARWSTCRAHFIATFCSQEHLFAARTWLDESLDGYEFRQMLVWHYRNISSKPKSRRGFKHSYEPILLYRRVDSDRDVRVSASEWGNDAHDMDCHVAAVPQSNFNGTESKMHAAQKPLSVMKWLVGCLTRQGDLVADPFAGSGTTGIACQLLGRRFHGIETNTRYRKLAEQRIATYGKIT